MISILDYGIGNCRAFAHIYHSLGIDYTLASLPEHLHPGQHIILPGVGAFDSALTRLKSSGMYSKLDSLVREKLVKVLGVCVGMQMMAEGSEEGQIEGLFWIPGFVRHFSSSSNSCERILPHMGWNDIQPATSTPLFSNISDPYFYFLHSYVFHPADPFHVLAHSCYPNPFAAAVSYNNVIGVQFHPEKSHHSGVQLLKNFSTF